MDADLILKYLKDWNFWGGNLNTGIERSIYIQKIISSMKTKEIIILSGIRRCGKSTLLLQVLKKAITDAKNSLIINLEDPRVVNINVKDLMQIYETYLESLEPDDEHCVVLDEVQNVPRWETFARYLSENRKINVFITGSNSKFLSSEFSSSLSGRYIEYKISPLCFNEFLEFKNLKIKSRLDIAKNERKIKKLFKEYVFLGGFPKVVLTDSKTEKNRILTSYYDTILIKDIALRHKIRNIPKLQDLSRFFLTNISKIISMNKIKDVLGVSLETIQRFSEYLENSYLLCFLPKFDYSYAKQVANPKKIYCLDSGLRNNAAFQFSKDYGRLLENLVYIELRKRNKQVYYYKTTNNLEIDFAVKEKNKISSLVQVTASLDDFSVRERELKSLAKGLEENNLKKGLILTEDSKEDITFKGFKIKVMPIWGWLLEVIE